MVGDKVKLLNVMVPEVKVTAASGLKMTVEEPAVKVPELVNIVPVVPVNVRAGTLAIVKVPPAAIIKNPVVRAWVEEALFRTDVAEVVRVIVVVPVGATVIAAPILTVNAKAEAAVGLIIKSPLMVKAPEPRV